MKQIVTHNSTGPSPSWAGRPKGQRPQRPSHLEPKEASLEVSAGGVIFRRRKGAVEFFFIKHGEGEGGKWTLPKGHQEPGETLLDTAVREIREEVGLENLRYWAPLGKTAFRFTQEGKLIEKHVHFFLFEAEEKAEAILTGEEGIWDSCWVPKEKVLETSGYKNLERLLRKALQLIERQPPTESE